MKNIKEINVFYNGKIVGRLCLTEQYLVSFQYAQEWLEDGFSISPRSLPLRDEVFLPNMHPFDGVFGVFADSLPDGWGRLLVDRMLLKNKYNPFEVSTLARLAIVGSSGMGALCYEPEFKLVAGEELGDYDRLALECKRILETDYSDDLDELFVLGGSSGGARPKILTEIAGEPWLVKFSSSQDSADIGRQEYEYSLCAKECGIAMTTTKLLPSKRCAGYFATKRFDRVQGKRVHMLSTSALLETSHRTPNLDYNILMRLTFALTKNMEEVKKLYRLMCFNVFAHNRDDHSKNFSFLYDDVANVWKLAPAYDLTYSYSLGGEHATTVDGNGANPGMADLLAVAKNIGLDEGESKRIAVDIQECVQAKLGEWLHK